MSNLNVKNQEVNIGDFRFMYVLGFGISKEKLFYWPNGEAPNYCELKLKVQNMGESYFLPAIRDLKAAQDVLKLRIGIDSVFTDSLLVWPGKNFRFSRRIRPEIEEKSEYPILLEGTTVEEEKGKYFFNGGKRTEIKNFPRKSTKITEPIEELGLDEGTKIIVKENLYSEEGFRNLVLSDKDVACVLDPLRKSHKGFFLCRRGNAPETLDDYL
jgi:hypothetical protein